MSQLNIIQLIAVWLLPVLFAITLHEAAHGWVARLFGDRTAQMLGRVTLNPLKHIDPVGTILVPGLLLLFGSATGNIFLFGWAKPVPVTVRNLGNPRRDMAFVAAAGPAANLLMGVFWALVARFGVMLYPSLGETVVPLIYMGGAGILINLVLAVLNLLPVPPLDGGRVLSSLLPGRWSWQLGRIEPYGLLIVLGLLATGLLGQIMSPIIGALQSVLISVAGIAP